MYTTFQSCKALFETPCINKCYIKRNVGSPSQTKGIRRFRRTFCFHFQGRSASQARNQHEVGRKQRISLLYDACYEGPVWVWRKPHVFRKKECDWNFSLDTDSGAHPASYLMGTGGSFPGGKATVAWSWQLTYMQCGGRENVGPYIRSPIRLHGVVLN
jgi:hypothetical protein